MPRKKRWGDINGNYGDAEQSKSPDKKERLPLKGRKHGGEGKFQSPTISRAMAREPSPLKTSQPNEKGKESTRLLRGGKSTLPSSSTFNEDEG